MTGYLVDVTARLSNGLGECSREWQRRHAGFVRGMQRRDGGFCGREGEGDLYYTGFALRSLAILGELDQEVAGQAARFFRHHLSNKTSIVDFFSLIYGASLLHLTVGVDVFQDAASNWRSDVAAALEELRREDGGYAKGPEGAMSSTYHTFLVLLCLEMLNQPIASPELIVNFLMSQRSQDGGFREIRVQKRASTNPTAAAIAALSILGVLEEHICSDVIGFLLEMRTQEGGLRANSRIPVADLLSTFTGLLTLTNLGARDEIDVSGALRYAKSLETPQGGFRGATWDTGTDVEYTFYGLGCVGLVEG